MHCYVTHTQVGESQSSGNVTAETYDCQSCNGMDGGHGNISVRDALQREPLNNTEYILCTNICLRSSRKSLSTRCKFEDWNGIMIAVRRKWTHEARIQSNYGLGRTFFRLLTIDF